MKRFTLWNILLLTAPLTALSNRPAVSVISTRRDIFYFKVDKAFIGARIEVYDSVGKLILTDMVIHHKAIIDFYMEQPGIYSILVKKGDQGLSFTYNKVAPMHYSLEPFATSISMAQ